jgi:hypothetical protein
MDINPQKNVDRERERETISNERICMRRRRGYYLSFVS